MNYQNFYVNMEQHPKLLWVVTKGGSKSIDKIVQKRSVPAGLPSGARYVPLGRNEEGENKGVGPPRARL